MDTAIETIVSSLNDMHADTGEVLDDFGAVVRQRAPHLETSSNGVFVKDKHGRMRYQNRSFTELFAKGSDRSGSFGAEFLPPPIRRISTSTDSFVASFGRPIRIECMIECRSTELPFEVFKFPLLSRSKSQPNGIIGVTRELTLTTVGRRSAANGKSNRSAFDRERLGRLDDLINENNAKLCLLTNQQLKVVCLLSLGRTNREVASELGVSRRTVEMHRQVARRRLRVNSLYEMLRMVALSSFDVSPQPIADQLPFN